MAEELKENFGVESKLIAGEGGIFEVIANGEIVYEKAKTGRFPEPGEVTEAIKR